MKEITGEKEINTQLFIFYKTLFEPKIKVSNALIQDYLSHIEIPKLTKEQSQKCDGVITEAELLNLTSGIGTTPITFESFEKNT